MTDILVTAEPVEVTVAGDPVEVTIAATPLAITVETIGAQGPRGPQGAAGAAGNLAFEHAQATPAATWTIAVPPEFGRRPVVGVYIADEAVFTDVVADASTVTITFPAPTSGTAVLT